ncbi:MAG: DUF2442 domain-containing protein [Chitinispirillia bacterium]|nr:DUF2442 domain-containing protein [Chitinispirillia bacterium]MCL2269541.1 DUF2442 domain-containing protein [Chitinispirillia bacterium]
MARVIHAELRGGYCVYVEFKDGKNGVIDLKSELEDDHRQIVRDLLDKEMFNTMRVDLGTLRWANEMDFCPDYLYNLVNAKKKVA